MPFTIFPFVVFFITVVTIYKYIPKKWRWALLLASGYYFYGYPYPAYVFVLIFITLLSFTLALAMGKYRAYKNFLLVIGLCMIFGILIIFKYYNFFAFSIKTFWNLPQFSLIMPLGISFYTFQTAAYLIDIYRERVKPERNLGYYALFVSFFPQISAGPIERAEELILQLKNPQSSHIKIVSGLKLFTLGLFKKLVVADNLAIVVDRVFSNLPAYKGMSLVLTMVLFSWQIYTDFSGYTDMARGIARMLGIELVPNFNNPYLATSFRDFWRRWHMSLSRWFKDYLYIPLGGNRKGITRTILNTIIVFTICGLWHGASWTFIVWGALHGLVMAVERISSSVYRKTVKVPRVLQIVFTNFLLMVTWIFFRASSMPDALYVLRYSVQGLPNFVRPMYILASVNQMFLTNRVEIVFTFALLLFVMGVETIGENRISNFVKRQPALIRFSMYTILVFSIVQFRNADIAAFIYTRF